MEILMASYFLKKWEEEHQQKRQETRLLMNSTAVDSRILDLVSLPFPMHMCCFYQLLKVRPAGTSLVVQWMAAHLPMQGTRVQPLVQEGSTCRRATKSMHLNH